MSQMKDSPKQRFVQIIAVFPPTLYTLLRRCSRKPPNAHRRVQLQYTSRHNASVQPAAACYKPEMMEASFPRGKLLIIASELNGRQLLLYELKKKRFPIVFLFLCAEYLPCLTRYAAETCCANKLENVRHHISQVSSFPDANGCSVAGRSIDDG